MRSVSYTHLDVYKRQPSLGMITINALVAADRVLIPVEAAYLPVKGLQQLIKTIGRVHRKLNPELSIMGILFTKVDRRTNFAKDIAAQIREVYGNKIHILSLIHIYVNRRIVSCYCPCRNRKSGGLYGHLVCQLCNIF